jgi:MFS family permease
MGALLALGQPAAAGMVAIVASLGTLASYAMLPAVVAGCALPLLLTRARMADPGVSSPERILTGRRDLWAAWLARLLVQIAANVLFFYLFYYLGSKAPDLPAQTIALRMGSVMAVAYLAPLPIALALGQLAGRTGRTRSLLLCAAALSAAGLVGMAFARDFVEAAAAFCVCATGSSVFQSLQTAFAMRLLPSPHHRGRDLGLFNLANTLPALIGPLLTWTLATPHDFRLLLLVLAGLTLAGGIVMPRAPQRAGAAQ